MKVPLYLLYIAPFLLAQTCLGLDKFIVDTNYFVAEDLFSSKKEDAYFPPPEKKAEEKKRIQEEQEDGEFIIIDKESLEPIEQLDLICFDELEECQEKLIWGENKGVLYLFDGKIIQEKFKQFKNEHIRLERQYRYKPKETENYRLKQKHYVMFVCHGTGGPNPDYDHIATELMQDMMGIAAGIAENDPDRPIIDVIPVFWSGENCSDFRERSVPSLGLFIDSCAAYWDEVIFLGYSHGGNIGNLLNNYTNKKFLLNINLASPVRNEEWQESPLNTNLINLYSPTDLVQYLGSINMRSWLTVIPIVSWFFAQKKSCRSFKELCKGKQVYYDDGRRHNQHKNSAIANIKFTYDNVGKNHTRFAHTIAKQVPSIIGKVLREFNHKEGFFNLSCNYVPLHKAMMNQCDSINLSIIPPETFEEKEMYKKIPEDIIKRSEQYRLEHKKIYGEEKDKKQWCLVIGYYYVAGVICDIFS